MISAMQEKFEEWYGFEVCDDMDIHTQVAWDNWQIAWQAAKTHAEEMANEHNSAMPRGMRFAYQTAADIILRRNLSREKLLRFVDQAKRMHDDNESLTRVIFDIRRELALRDGEIAMLKCALLKQEEAE